MVPEGQRRDVLRLGRGRWSRRVDSPSGRLLYTRRSRHTRGSGRSRSRCPASSGPAGARGVAGRARGGRGPASPRTARCWSPPPPSEPWRHGLGGPSRRQGVLATVAEAPLGTAARLRQPRGVAGRPSWFIVMQRRRSGHRELRAVRWERGRRPTLTCLTFRYAGSGTPRGTPAATAGLCSSSHSQPTRGYAELDWLRHRRQRASRAPDRRRAARTAPDVAAERQAPRAAPGRRGDLDLYTHGPHAGGSDPAPGARRGSLPIPEGAPRPRTVPRISPDGRAVAYVNADGAAPRSTCARSPDRRRPVAGLDGRRTRIPHMVSDSAGALLPFERPPDPGRPLQRGRRRVPGGEAAPHEQRKTRSTRRQRLRL